MSTLPTPITSSTPSNNNCPSRWPSSKTSTRRPSPGTPAFWPGPPAKSPSTKFLKGLLALAPETDLSLERAASVIGLAAQTTYTKQALSERLSHPIQPFLAQVITAALGQLPHSVDTSRFLEPFARVLVQDSTVQSLPKHLADLFPGGGNQHGHDCADLKIQWICDLKNSAVEHVSLSGFTRNDQTAAPDILEVARPGDLVLRDLGYFVASLLGQFAAQGVFFLTRHLHCAELPRPADRPAFRFARPPAHQPVLDFQLLLGTERVPVRLVALPVPEEVANLRRHRAKAYARRHFRAPPSKEHLFLMGWNLLLTNVPASIWPPKALAAVYRLRWRIEIIFKTWKSHLGIVPPELSHRRFVATLRTDQAALLRAGLPDVRRAGTALRRGRARQPVAPWTHPWTMGLLVLCLGAGHLALGLDGVLPSSPCFLRQEERPPELLPIVGQRQNLSLTRMGAAAPPNVHPGNEGSRLV